MDLAELTIQNGNRHPWEIARAATLHHLLKERNVIGQHKKVLDVGCGDGFAVSSIFTAKELNIDAVDTSLTEAMIAEFSQTLQPISFHKTTQSLQKNYYNIITIFDVIEHTPNDTSFLTEIASHAAPGAKFIITAPAFNKLYSTHDSFLKHYRRYNKKELDLAIQSAGLEPIESGYLFTSLLFLRAIGVIMEKLFPKSAPPTGVAKWQHGRRLTSMIASYLTAENKVSLWLHQHNISLPGLSVWAVCKKQQ